MSTEQAQGIAEAPSRRWRWIALGLVAVALLAWGLHAWLQRQPSAIAERWLQAARAEEWAAAREAAHALVDVQALPPPSEAYVDVAERNDLAVGYLSAPFTDWDARFWYQAASMRELALELTEGADDPVRVLMEAVHQRVEFREANDGEAPWPWVTWEKGLGVCDRQAWVVCELAYQLGMDAVLVYLMKPGTGISPHTICEIRWQGRVWTVDPSFGVLLPDLSVHELRQDPALIRARWPDYPEYVEALQEPIFWIPAFPLDYCPRNQALGPRVRDLLGPAAPRFGEDPQTRGQRYQELSTAELGEDFDIRIGLWFYPLGILGLEIRNNR